MEYRKLGRTGLDVSVLSLGTMTWGEQNTEAEGHAQMDLAVEHGVTLFDVAEMYPSPPKPATQGRTEEIIGSWFAARPGRREKTILASKVCGRSQSDWYRDDGRPTTLARADILEAVDKSLRRLRTDYIDLYQVHFPDRAVPGFGSNPVIWKTLPPAPEVPIEETLAALDEVVKAGKARFIGVSNESAWGLMTWLKLSETQGRARVQSIQNAYSLANRTFEVNLAETVIREQVGLLTYSSLAQGGLTGKYADGALPPGARKTLFNRMQRYEKPGAAEAFAAYVALAREFGLDPAQMALKFAATRPFVTAVLLGATTLDQLRTNLASLDVPFPAELQERIDAIHQLHANPCP